MTTSKTEAETATEPEAAVNVFKDRAYTLVREVECILRDPGLRLTDESRCRFEGMADGLVTVLSGNHPGYLVSWSSRTSRPT